MHALPQEVSLISILELDGLTNMADSQTKTGLGHQVHSRRQIMQSTQIYAHNSRVSIKPRQDQQPDPSRDHALGVTCSSNTHQVVSESSSQHQAQQKHMMIHDALHSFLRPAVLSV